MFWRRCVAVVGVLLLLSGVACSGVRENLQDQAKAVNSDPVWPDFAPVFEDEEIPFASEIAEEAKYDVEKCAVLTNSSESAKCVLDKSVEFLQVQSSCYSSEDSAEVEAYLDGGNGTTWTVGVNCLDVVKLEAGHYDIWPESFDSGFGDLITIDIEKSTDNLQYQVVVYAFKKKK